MKNRTTWEITIASVIFLIIGVAYYIIRQRLRLQRERTDRYLLLAEEANTQYKPWQNIWKDSAMQKAI